MEDPDWIYFIWTHDDCIDIMKATDFELNKHQLCDYCAILECVMGQHTETTRAFDLMNDRVVSNLGQRHDHLY